jgi:plastocyanin domain-containing protein
MRRSWESAMLGACLALASCVPPEQKQAGSGNEVAITVTESGFEPAQATVPKGEPVTLVFTRKTDRTCVTEVVVSRLGKTFPLPLDQPVRVSIPGGVKDSLGFVCGMNMFTGTVVAK